MADWFKFYENDLDETRLQYAISQLPEVIPVWVGILSEACRHKVGTVSWGKDEIEMFGFSKRLGVSIPKVNEAVLMLAKIRYITLGENTINITKWGEKQSEYCQKRTKNQNQSGQNHHTKKDSVPTMSRQCPDNVRQEERRGEEIRVVAPLPPKVEGSRFEVLKEQIEMMFSRPKGARWGNMEERDLVEVSNRESAIAELALIQGWILTVPEERKRFESCPKTVAKLLQCWTEYLDKANATTKTLGEKNPSKTNKFSACGLTWELGGVGPMRDEFGKGTDQQDSFFACREAWEELSSQQQEGK